MQEYLKRFAPRPTLRHPDFHEQNKAIDDKSPLRAWNATRRGAKTTSAAIDIIETMEEFPKKKNLFLALTLDSAREIIWDDLKDLAEKMGWVIGVDIKFNEARSIARHKNGASVRLFGVNTSAKEMRKVLGQKYKKVFIDESGSMTIDMVKLCYQMIGPALIDYDGQLTLLGTCENIPKTFFEKVTTGKEPGWSVHRWTSDKNPYVRDAWLKKKNDLIKENPNVVHASWFRTHYLNEWCQDDDLLIIPYLESRNSITTLPSGLDWNYVLGVDLGFNDATSFSVLAFHPDHPICYRIMGYKEKGLILSQAGKRIEKLREQYDFFKIVIDGANKQGVEDLKQRMGLPLVAAEKTGKPVYLKAMKDAMITGTLKVINGANNSWIEEISHLQWSDETMLKEDPRCENHENDGTLYAWRECKQYLYSPGEGPVIPNTSEFMNKIEQKLADELEQRLMEEQEQWMQNHLENY
jgi:hypothetical protein